MEVVSRAKLYNPSLLQGIAAVADGAQVKAA
jgi:hypothetical protein